MEKNDLEICDCNAVHAEIIRDVIQKMPLEENLYDLADLFKVFGDTTRIRILCALTESKMCVCDIADLLDVTQSAISHQLRILKQARLIKSHREGKVIYYSLNDIHVKQIFELGLIHINE